MTNDDEPVAAEPEYDLRVTGNGVSISRKVPESVALGIIALVMGGSGGAGVAPRVPSGSPRFTGGGMSAPAQSVGEYMMEVEAKRNPDKILAFGAYLMDYMGRQTFTRDEVRSMFQQAAEPIPANFHRDFSWAATNKWLSEQPGTPGAFYVTSAGRKALDGKFGKEVKSTTKLTRRRRTKKATTAPAVNDG